ncbi:MAG: VWA domain-containing protein [Candidatus Electryonea clarkiae]|nr:VWA domain-containing protein [Candidatus Electryonea clarkiae]MDP8287507.1 VWA domain-containing protein [Candidatus Electryonea clarkiae]
MTWADPWFFLLLVSIPIAVVYYWWRETRKPAPTVIFPTASQIKPLMSRVRRLLRHLPVFLRLSALGFLVVAFARPQTALDEEKIKTEGIDLVIALDISTSMLAEDLKPSNRITAAKKVAKEFIAGRRNDRIGLVMFAGEAYTWCPLTLDYDVLSELMDKIEAGSVVDGTAIGKAIAVGANRLRHSDAKSKVFILLTDGVNNVDQPDPLTAARAASEVGVKVYTIGVGTRGVARAPVQTPFGIKYRQVKVEIDEDLLRQIAKMTGGKYFRATSTEALREIYVRIDEMEKTFIDIEHMRSYEEEFYLWAGLALILILIERLLVMTRFRNMAS